MSRTLRSSFATLALLTAMMGAPPAQTKAQREALAQALRREVYPVHVVFDSERREQSSDEFDILVFGRDGDPIVVVVRRL
ncbi:MAG: hypothetical protein JSW71_17630 [Gemmatimonadota bacterium]|nr:MAG: hypothetical protein JSW71_17630 [Gemmatimonadota bacterium]